MIRKLNEADRQQALEYLSEESAINLFIIGDIEGFGFDEDFMEIWAEFDDEQAIEGLLLRFYENYIPYSKEDDYDWTSFKKMITDEEERVDTHIAMSGKASILRRFDDILPNHGRKSTYFCELRSSEKLKVENPEDVLIATVDDAPRVHALIEEIEEFQSVNDVNRIKHTLETNTGRIYYREDNGLMITVAQTTAENSMSAMVVGVATLPEHRKRGLMSGCLSKLCMDILQEGKTLCLFYNNPEAGKVYHKLGFETLDQWIMISNVDA